MPNMTRYADRRYAECRYAECRGARSNVDKNSRKLEYFSI
jgi:hypothetical protein